MNVTRTVDVALAKDEAFSLFTSGIGEWWPLREGFSYGAERCASIHLEPTVGGRFFERFVDGDEFQVGTVVECDAPHRIVFTWAPPTWAGPTEVEVRFHGDASGPTTVDLEHRGFADLGDDGQAIRDGFANGWPSVLEAFGRRASERP